MRIRKRALSVFMLSDLKFLFFDPTEQTHAFRHTLLTAASPTRRRSHCLFLLLRDKHHPNHETFNYTRATFHERAPNYHVPAAGWMAGWLAGWYADWPLKPSIRTLFWKRAPNTMFLRLAGCLAGWSLQAPGAQTVDLHIGVPRPRGQTVDLHIGFPNWDPKL